jgi:putative phosphoesterase
LSRRWRAVKLARISDVHANIVALGAVLEDMEHRGVDTILCAGDVVGYYPNPVETIAAFRARRIISIQGNHDRAVLSAGDADLNPMASSAVMWTAGHIDAPSREYLRTLPRSLRAEMGGVRIAVYHGAPFDDDHYIFEDEASEELLRMAGCDLLVLGHTHVPFIRRHSRGIIVNPGSVGQPRDGDPDASYAIFDTERRRAAYFRVPYDFREVAERTLGAGLPSFLAERLRRGR